MRLENIVENIVAGVALGAAVLTMSPDVRAQQDAKGRQRYPSSARSGAGSSGSGSTGVPAPPRELAVPRAAAPPPPAAAPASPSGAAASPRPERAATPPPQRRAAPDNRSVPQRRAVPRERPRGDNPRAGTAVPRQGPPPDPGGSGGGIYTPRPRIYNNYYYYPRRYSPYGYGGFGLGYFYYDPYGWSLFDNRFDRYDYRYRDRHDYDTGELRLDVRPRDAEVYVDGYYAGTVDDFDGIFQGLRLAEGRYRIEIVSPGFEPLDFDVQITRGREIRYRGELLRRRR